MNLLNYNYETHLLADETIFQIDIDGDNHIGNKVVESYNESGSKSLYKVESGDYILANSTATIGNYPDQQKLLLKDDKPFEFTYKPSASYSYSTYTDPNYPHNEDWIVEVYSGYENNWVKDTFDGDGQFVKSKNLNLTQLSHLEPNAHLDFNGDGVIGNVIYKKFGSEHHFGSSNNYIEQLKTYELLSGGYVLSKNDHALNTVLHHEEHDYHAGRMGPGLLLETESKGQTSLFSFKNDPVSAYSERFDNGQNANGDMEYSIDYYVVSGSGNSWVIDEFNTDGLYQKQHKYTLKSLLDEELKYNIDLNADNVIGDGVALSVEGGGGRGLYKLVTGDYYFANAGMPQGHNLIDPATGANAIKSSVKFSNSQLE